jgi:hypothetical protein
VLTKLICLSTGLARVNQDPAATRRYVKARARQCRERTPALHESRRDATLPQWSYKPRKNASTAQEDAGKLCSKRAFG